MAIRTRCEEFICSIFYGKHHLEVDCTLLARELERVISNYDALTDVERSRAPATVHWEAKSFFAICMSPTDKVPDNQYAEAHYVIQVRGSAAGNSAMNKPNVLEN